MIDEATGWLTENQDSLVEITIASETYLSAVDRKRLLEAHSGILIIPELKNTGEHPDDAALTGRSDKGNNGSLLRFLQKGKGPGTG